MTHIEDYKERLVDQRIDQLMNVFGAISLVGAKFCGKSTCALHHVKSDVSLMDPVDNYSARTLAQMNPNITLEGENPRLVDEWQEVPQIWDAVRFACDSRPKESGLFMLTGSSLPKGFSHSGAGRIATVRLLTMSLYEMGDSSGLVSLQKLFDAPLDTVNTGSVDVKDLIRFVCRGGWPRFIDEKYRTCDPTITLEQAKGYIKKVIDTDFNNIGQFKRKKSARLVSAFLASLARNDNLPAKFTDISADIEKHDGIVMNRVTVPNYLDLLYELYLIEDQPAFNPGPSITRSTLKLPKRRFVDPSLLVAALDKEPDMLYNDVPTLEAAFDNLCVHDLKVYAEAINAKVYHYKDAYEYTADSVVVLKDGRWGAFRHCISVHQIDNLAAELVRLRKTFDNSTDQPSILGIICGTTPAAYTRRDGILVFPITALKP